MKTVELDYVTLTFIDDRTVLKEMSADYGMIINRKEDYSIAPVQVYGVLNSLERLRAIAIVNHKARTAISVETEQKLFRGQLKDFTTVDAARGWLDAQLVSSAVN